MGYNGSNRGRSNRGYKGFPKSSVNFGSRVTFGRNGVVTNLFKAADTMIKSKPPKSTYYNTPPTYLPKTDSGNTNTGVSASTIILIALGIIAGILIIVYAPWLIFAILILVALFR